MKKSSLISSGLPQLSFYCIAFFIIIGLLIIPLPTYCQAKNVLWQIGVVDSSYHEFGQNIFVQTGAKTNHYAIDNDIPEKWSAVLPSIKEQESAQEIEFSIRNLRDGYHYELSLNCIFRTPRIPHLSISVNSHAGHHVFTPQRISRIKDSKSYYIHNYSYECVTISIPSSSLKNGMNSIKFTVHNESALPLDSLTWQREKTPEQYGTAGSVYWDAVIFSETITEINLLNPYAVNFNPTVFYVKRGEQLFEWINADITLSKPIIDGNITLTAGESNIYQRMSVPYEFGKIRQSFLIPMNKESCPLKWEINSSGEKYTGETILKSTKKWTIYVTLRSHLDVGYTEGQAASLDIHTHSIDKAFKLIESYPQYRWNLEGTLITDEYAKNHSEDKFQLLLQYLKDEKMSLNSLVATPLSQLASLEELFRSNYAGVAIRRKFGIPINVASITDVPSVTMALPDVLSHLDIPYLIVASNPYRGGPINLIAQWYKQSPLWWEGLAGGKVLLWYSDHYHQGQYFFGFPADLQVAGDQIPLLLQEYTFPEFQPDAIMIYGLRSDNRFIGDGDADFLTKWNEWFEYPKVKLATDREYFDYINARFPTYPKTVRGDGGAYWEDGAGSSIRETVMARQAKFQLTGAEKLISFTSLFYPSIRYPAENIQKVWNDIILYTEHTWGSHASTSMPRSQDAQAQWAVKQSFARNAGLGAHNLLESGFKQLEGILDVPENSVLVFNSCNWTRSDWIEIELGEGLWPLDDKTGLPVTGEIIKTGEGYYTIKFFAMDVPSLGVKIYKTERKNIAASPEIESIAENNIETPYYRISLDKNEGFIHSIVDLETQKELIDHTSSYKMNQYLYVLGGEKSKIVTGDYDAPPPDLQIIGSYSMNPPSLKKTPAGWTISFKQQAPYTPSISSEWHFYEKIKRIDITNRFYKNENERLEASYYAFPFSFSKPDIYYDIQTGWLNPRTEQIKGACSEWFCLQNGTRLTSEGNEILLMSPDVPLITFGDIVKGQWGKPFSMDNGTLYSYILNNYWDTNYQRLQSGEYVLHYSITSGKQSSPDLRLRQSLEISHPLDGYSVKRLQLSSEKKITPIQNKTFSFLNINPESVYCVAVKGAEDGRGIICRLLNLADRDVSVSISSDIFHINSAIECKGDESEMKTIPRSQGVVNYNFKPHQIATMRLFIDRK